MTDETEIQQPEQEQVEREARNLGWVPKEEFKGSEDQWESAEEFLDRGKKLLPILNQNNKRLQRELLTRDQKLGTLESKLDAATELIAKLEQRAVTADKRAIANARAALKDELKQAREDNDVDAEFAVQDKLSELQKAEEELSKPAPVKKDQPTQPGTPPELKAWYDANPWFGTDLKKTKLATRIAEDLRDEGSTLVGAEFMEEVARLLAEQEQPTQRRPISKVEGVPVNQGHRSGNGKAFTDLPKEAQQACLADVDDLVGPGKRFAKLEDWKKRYTELYFEDEQS